MDPESQRLKWVNAWGLIAHTHTQEHTQWTRHNNNNAQVTYNGYSWPLAWFGNTRYPPTEGSNNDNDNNDDDDDDEAVIRVDADGGERTRRGIRIRGIARACNAIKQHETCKATKGIN